MTRTRPEIFFYLGVAFVTALAGAACSPVSRGRSVRDPWEMRVSAAATYAGAMDYAKAEEELQAAFRIAEEGGPEDPRIAPTLDRLGSLYISEGRDGEAEASYRRSLAIRESQLGSDHLEVTQSLLGLVEVQLWRGQYAEADRLYHRVLAIRVSRLGPDHPLVGRTLHHVARGHTLRREYTEAERLYLRAIAIQEQSLGLEHPYVAESLQGYAELLRLMGREADADRLDARARRILGSGPAPR